MDAIIILLLVLVIIILIAIVRFHESLRQVSEQIEKLTRDRQGGVYNSGTIHPDAPLQPQATTPIITAINTEKALVPPYASDETTAQVPCPQSEQPEIKSAILLSSAPAVENSLKMVAAPLTAPLCDGKPSEKTSPAKKAWHWICSGEEDSSEQLSHEYTTVTTWLIRGGVLAVLASLVFLLKFSFDRQYFSIQMLVILLTFAGVAVALGGVFFLCKKPKSKYRNWILTVSGGGFALAFFALFAGCNLYAVYPEWLAFVLLGIVASLAVGAAWKTNAMSIGIVGCIGGFAAPLCFESIGTSCFALLWITAVNLGALWLAYRKNWILQYCAVAFLYAVAMLHIYESLKDAFFMETLPVLFLNCFAPLVPCLLKNKENNFSNIHLFTHGFSLVVFLSVVIPPAVELNIYVPAMITFLVGLIALRGLYCCVKTEKTVMKNFFSIISCVMAAATIYFLLNGTQWLTAFLAFAAVMMAVCASKYRLLFLGVSSVILLIFTVFTLPEFLPPTPYLAYLLHNISSYWIYVLSIILTGCALNHASGDDEVSKTFSSIAQIVLFLGGVAAFACITAECWQAMNVFIPAFATVGLSIVWGLIGVIVLAWGICRKILALRLSALVIFFATALKVLCFDMSGVGMVLRSVVSASIGILLLLAALLYVRRKDFFKMQ